MRSIISSNDTVSTATRSCFFSVEVVLHKLDGEERMPSKTLPIQRIVILTRMQLRGVFAGNSKEVQDDTNLIRCRARE